MTTSGVLLAVVAGLSVLAYSPANAQTTGSGRVALYASVGAELTQYDVDIASATLTKRATVTLPANVQYAWPHPSRQYFYVAWSNGAPGGGPGAGGSRHGVSAFRIDPATGALHP